MQSLRHECAHASRRGVVWRVAAGKGLEQCRASLRRAAILLVVGTSAAVYPAAGLISLAKAAGSKIVIVNTQPSDASALADIELLGPAGEIVPRILA